MKGESSSTIGAEAAIAHDSRIIGRFRLMMRHPKLPEKLSGCLSGRQPESARGNFSAALTFSATTHRDLSPGNFVRHGDRRDTPPRCQHFALVHMMH